MINTYTDYIGSLWRTCGKVSQPPNKSFNRIITQNVQGDFDTWYELIRNLIKSKQKNCFPLLLPPFYIHEYSQNRVLRKPLLPLYITQNLKSDTLVGLHAEIFQKYLINNSKSPEFTWLISGWHQILWFFSLPFSQFMGASKQNPIMDKIP